MYVLWFAMWVLCRYSIHVFFSVRDGHHHDGAQFKLFLFVVLNYPALAIECPRDGSWYRGHYSLKCRSTKNLPSPLISKIFFGVVSRNRPATLLMVDYERWKCAATSCCHVLKENCSFIKQSALVTDMTDEHCKYTNTTLNDLQYVLQQGVGQK